MVKGWNRNRGWNNGWGSNRKNRNGAWDLTWANHSEIETVERVRRGLIAGHERKTEGLVPETTGEGTMTGAGQTTRVVVTVDYGSQVLVWTPDLDHSQLESWFLSLSEEDIENIWTSPRSLPGRVDPIAIAPSIKPTHVLSFEGKDFVSLNWYDKDYDTMLTLHTKSFQS